jgi:tRNA nucleotidyltransferase (CCA-adding enzyme)
VADFAAKRGQRLFLVGGVVRDLLRGLPALDEDVDFVVEGNAIEFAEELQKISGGSLRKFTAFITAKIEQPSLFAHVREIDFASARTERYLTPGALPEVTPSKLEEDLGRRDFSVNAIALEVKHVLELMELTHCQQQELEKRCFDLHAGIQDLRSKTLRVLHSRSFVDDPTRILRLARYMIRLDAKPDTITEQLVGAAVDAKMLEVISVQRFLTELRKVMEERDPWAILTQLQAWKVTDAIDRLELESSKTVLARFFRLKAAALHVSAEVRYWLFLQCLVSADGVQTWAETLAPLGFKKQTLRVYADELRACISCGEVVTSERVAALREALDLARC